MKHRQTTWFISHRQQIGIPKDGLNKCKKVKEEKNNLNINSAFLNVSGRIECLRILQSLCCNHSLHFEVSHRFCTNYNDCLGYMNFQFIKHWSSRNHKSSCRPSNFGYYNVIWTFEDQDDPFRKDRQNLEYNNKTLKFL